MASRLAFVVLSALAASSEAYAPGGAGANLGGRACATHALRAHARANALEEGSTFEGLKVILVVTLLHYLCLYFSIYAENNFPRFNRMIE